MSNIDATFYWECAYFGHLWFLFNVTRDVKESQMHINHKYPANEVKKDMIFGIAWVLHMSNPLMPIIIPYDILHNACRVSINETTT